jgi:SPX domain protein involved in polyphosphate accumulation
VHHNREMALLQNFCILNYTGFVKILKKHDKVRPDLTPSDPVQAPA